MKGRDRGVEITCSVGRHKLIINAHKHTHTHIHAVSLRVYYVNVLYLMYVN